MGGNNNRIDELVKGKGVSFRWLARSVGVSPRHLRYIRQGSDLHLDLAQRIADALDEPLERVFPK